MISIPSFALINIIPLAKPGKNTTDVLFLGKTQVARLSVNHWLETFIDCFNNIMSLLRDRL